MKVKCIINTQAGVPKKILHVTIGKIYHVYGTDDTGYRIIDDLGRLGMYWKGRFEIATAEMRNELLEELGI